MRRIVNFPPEERILNKDSFCQCDLLGIPTMFVTECAWLALAWLPHAHKAGQWQKPRVHFTCHLYRQALCHPSSEGRTREGVCLPLLEGSSCRSSSQPLTLLESMFLKDACFHVLCAFPLCLRFEQYRSLNSYLALPSNFTLTVEFHFILLLCGLAQSSATVSSYLVL